MQIPCLVVSVGLAVTANGIPAKINDVIPRAVQAGERITVQIEVPQSSDFKKYVFVVFYRENPARRQHQSPALRDGEEEDADPKPGVIKYVTETDVKWLSAAVLAGKKGGEKYRIVLLYSENRKLEGGAIVELMGNTEDVTVTPSMAAEGRSEDVIRSQVAWLEEGVDELARIEQQREVRTEFGRTLMLLEGRPQGDDVALVWEDVLIRQRDFSHRLDSDTGWEAERVIPLALQEQAEAYSQSAEATQETLKLVKNEAERKGLLGRLAAVVGKLGRLLGAGRSEKP